VSEELVTVERSQAIRVPADQLWTLMSGPQAWSVQPNRFAFDVTVPPGTRLRILLGVHGTRPFVGTYELEDQVPGQAMSMRFGPQASAAQVISFSAVAGGDATAATITFRNRGPQARAAREHRERWLTEWLSGLREVAEGHAPDPGPGMPESLRARCTPAPLRKPATASASALIAAPPAAVWDVIYAPESALTVNAGIVAAGVVPGTPARQAGEMQYFACKYSGGWFTTQVAAVTELDPGRSAQTVSITSPHCETGHLITPQGHRTRLELTYRWPGSIPGGRSKAYAREMTDALQRAVNGYQNLIDDQGNSQPLRPRWPSPG
jgi:hypothetical protein